VGATWSGAHIFEHEADAAGDAVPPNLPVHSTAALARKRRTRAAQKFGVMVADNGHSGQQRARRFFA
jgi:hypothetical protein